MVTIGFILAFSLGSGAKYKWDTGDWSPQTKDNAPCDNIANCNKTFNRNVTCYKGTTKVDDKYCSKLGSKPLAVQQCICCNNHGSVNDDKCICDQYWTGKDCETCTDNAGCAPGQTCIDGKCNNVKSCSNCKKTDICIKGKCVSLCGVQKFTGTFSGKSGKVPVQTFDVTSSKNCVMTLKSKEYGDYQPTLTINPDGTCVMSKIDVSGLPIKKTC